MLTIKTASQNERVHVSELLKDIGLVYGNLESIGENCMVAYENETLLAAAGFEILNDIGILRFVAVKENRQNEYLGDSIVKAILNMADKKGVRIMLVQADKMAAFFIKVGFKEINPLLRDDPALKMLLQKEFKDEAVVLQATLPDFFLKACRFNKG